VNSLVVSALLAVDTNTHLTSINQLSNTSFACKTSLVVSASSLEALRHTDKLVSVFSDAPLAQMSFLDVSAFAFQDNSSTDVTLLQFSEASSAITAVLVTAALITDLADSSVTSISQVLDTVLTSNGVSQMLAFSAVSAKSAVMFESSDALLALTSILVFGTSVTNSAFDNGSEVATTRASVVFTSVAVMASWMSAVTTFVMVSWVFTSVVVMAFVMVSMVTSNSSFGLLNNAFDNLSTNLVLNSPQCLLNSVNTSLSSD
jgi:hypothetical protein